MQVKESGGEVSASVEETNRIRAALGLAPLKGTIAAAPTAGAGDALGDAPGIGPAWTPAVHAAAESHVGAAVSEDDGSAQDGAGAVLGLELDRYTRARPKWK